MDLEATREFVERQARAWERADVEAIVNEFAEDGALISPGGRWQGHEAVRSTVSSFFAEASDVQITITRVVADGDQGALEWTWSETRLSDGSRRTAEDGIIFELCDGRIVYWREYFDTNGWR